MKSKETEALLERLLKKQFPTEEAACTEIINLEAILNLPKGTEHFLSDLHGEDEAFLHMLRNSSSVIKKSIDREFRDIISPPEKERLAITIYYPEEMIKKAKTQYTDIKQWYRTILHRLIKICRLVSSKYTRSKVRKALPKDFLYIIEELLHETEHGGNKKEYYDSIIESIISIERADDFILAICYVIQRLSIDKLHIVGDIFDRGPGPHRILDELINYHSVDIQWGNHDIVWMGAAMGNTACIATVIRMCAKYGHIDILEEGYGINLRPLASFASEVYHDDPCACFDVSANDDLTEQEQKLLKKMHKAIAIIQFKLEGQIILKNPQYQMEDRLLLDKIDADRQNVTIAGKRYPIKDQHFPTLDQKHPFKLTEAERDVIDRLQKAFIYNIKLKDHLKFLIESGSMYLTYNANLLLHGCVPMEPDGSLTQIGLFKQPVSGKAAMDAFEREIYRSYRNRKHSNNNTNIFWYLWCGGQSPLFGKDKMKTFESYMVEAKETHKEKRNPYYSFREDEDKCIALLREFGIHDTFSHIINGHVPVKVKDGELPIKANGRLIVIDGGLNPVYRPVTGIAGYTLIYDSYSLEIAQHEKFESKQKIIDDEKDILCYNSVCDQHDSRLRVRDTDIGRMLTQEIDLLNKLLDDYKAERVNL